LRFQDPLVADLVVAAKDALAFVQRMVTGRLTCVAVRLIVGVAVVGTIVVVAVAITGFCLRASRPDWAATEEESS
jgi:hypothetical protein